MPSLLDIAPPELSAEEVDIRGAKLRVRGVTGEEWAALYARFPILKNVMGGRAVNVPLLDQLRAQAALIAASLDKMGDAEIERAVLDRLTVGDQQVVLETIGRLSLPGAVFGPLLDEPAEAGDAAPGKEAVTK